LVLGLVGDPEGSVDLAGEPVALGTVDPTFGRGRVDSSSGQAEPDVPAGGDVRVLAGDRVGKGSVPDDVPPDGRVVIGRELGGSVEGRLDVPEVPSGLPEAAGNELSAGIELFIGEFPAGRLLPEGMLEKGSLLEGRELPAGKLLRGLLAGSRESKVEGRGFCLGSVVEPAGEVAGEVIGSEFVGSEFVGMLDPPGSEY
jgi:hypothetical protein